MAGGEKRMEGMVEIIEEFEKLLPSYAYKEAEHNGKSNYCKRGRCDFLRQYLPYYS